MQYEELISKLPSGTPIRINIYHSVKDILYPILRNNGIEPYGNTLYQFFEVALIFTGKTRVHKQAWIALSCFALEANVDLSELVLKAIRENK